jgi:hypothetical protein
MNTNLPINNGEIDQAKKKEEEEKAIKSSNRYLDNTLKIVVAMSLYLFILVIFGSVLYKRKQDLDHKRTMYTDNSSGLPYEMLRLSELLDNLCTLRAGTREQIEPVLAQFMNKSNEDKYPDKPYTLDDAKIEQQLSYSDAVETTKSLKTEELYYQFNKVLNLYNDDNFYQTSHISIPFPWTEIIMHSMMLVICIVTLSIVYANFSPYVMADDVTDLKKCELALADKCDKWGTEQEKKACEEMKKEPAKLKADCTRQASPNSVSSEIVKVSILVATLVGTIYMCGVVLDSTLTYGTSLKNYK